MDTLSFWWLQPPGRTLVVVFVVEQYANVFAARALVALPKSKLYFIANTWANATDAGLMEEDIGTTCTLADEAEALNFIESINHAGAKWQRGDIHLRALLAASWRIRIALDHIDLNRARALRATTFNKFNTIAFTEWIHSNDRAMYEKIITAGISGNKPETFLGVEPFDCSCLHILLFLLLRSVARLIDTPPQSFARHSSSQCVATR